MRTLSRPRAIRVAAHACARGGIDVMMGLSTEEMPRAMAKNRFEQVDEIQPDAITLHLKKEGDQEVGSVVFPMSASNGRLTEDRVSPNLPIIESYRSAIRLANEMKLALVIMDPDGVWKAEFGDLYRPV
jgi:hypothetical protein